MTNTDAAGDHSSSNLNKYTTPNRIYRWHIDRFFKATSREVHQFEPQSILDAGCGEGYFTNYLARSLPDSRVTGTDLSHDAIAYASNRFGDGAAFSVGDVYELPFPSNAFDVVVCSEVLEHLDQPERALEEVIRVAAVGVVLTVPLEPYFKFFNDLARKLGISPDPGHVNFWNRHSFPEFVLPFLPTAVFRTVDYYHLASSRVGRD